MISIRYMPIYRPAAVLFLVVGLFWTATASADNAETLTKAVQVRTGGAEMQKKWGIQVTSIRMSANDHMIDFRYRVLDAKKADKLFAKGDKPYLIDQKTGKVLAVPRTAKVGPLMSTYQHKQGRIYWMFFGNRGNLVKAGSKVNVVIGEFKAENLTVE